VKNVKIWVRLAIAVLLAVIVSGGTLIQLGVKKQAEIAERQARDFAESVHQMTLAGLTGLMYLGKMSERKIFLDQIKESNHIESLHVFRSDAVIRQFGRGHAGETPVLEEEIRVLQTGAAEYRILRSDTGRNNLRAIIPVRASRNYLGKDCLGCHTVPEGTVLGAVSMDISLDQAQRSAEEFGRNAMVAALLLCVPLGLFIWLFVSRLVSRPLGQLTGGLRTIAAGDIEAGAELPVRGRSEIDEAAAAFNEVMGKAHELIRQQRLSRAVFDNSLEGITVTDVNGRIQMVNRAFTDTTGYSAEEAIGQTPAMLKSGKQGETFYMEFWRALKTEGQWRGEIWNRRKNGTIYPEWLNVSAVRNARGDVVNYIAIFSDITERKEREELMTFRAFHDALTGLPNRLLFRDRLEQALAQARRHSARTPAVMFLDLDRFKQINDTLGHDVGDQLLKEVAARLKRCVRSVDTVARLAGDEFTVLLPEAGSEESIAGVADKILSVMQEPVRLGSEERVITTSIGISVYPRDGKDPDTLMKSADTAMYFVKGSGRADKCFFRDELQGETSRRVELEKGLRTALERRQFQLHFQPIMDLSAGTIHGMEALLRWPIPNVDIVLQPEDFIGMAEDVGLMLPIGEWVLEEACRQARAWQAEAPGRVIAVNLSAAEFRRNDLATMVRDTALRCGISPSLIELEIAEAVVMQDPDYSERVLGELAACGVKLSIDDFGTGYSSLTVLRRLPLHALKIHRSLISQAAGPQGDRAVLAAAFGIAGALGLLTVAEGVEKSDELELLRQFACVRAQGNLIGPPQP
jgi:diguanylate cyclase (GGDEF)-like protein/PAS domain S-box-containing protein